MTSSRDASLQLLVATVGRDDGLFAVGSSGLDAVDALPTVALAAGPGFLGRVLYSGRGGAELLRYDTRGLRCYERLDDISEARCLVSHRGSLFTTTARDGVVEIRAGRALARWPAPFEFPSSRISGLTTSDDTLVVTLVRQPGVVPKRRSGRLHDIGRRVDLAVGFEHPTSPVRVDGTWLVGEKHAGEIVELNDGGEVTRRVRVAKRVDALAADGRVLAVGAHDGVGLPVLVIVDLDGFHVVERMPLPSATVADVAFIPPALVDAARSTAARANAVRFWRRRALDPACTAEVAPHDGHVRRRTLAVLRPKTR